MSRLLIRTFYRRLSGIALGILRDDRVARIAFIALAVIACSARAVAQSEQSIDPRIQKDIARLVEAARKLDTAWPWQAPIPETEAVVAHGKAAGPALASQLKYSSQEQWGTETWDLHVEQQVALALCEIYAVRGESGRTVYGVRAKEKDNESVRSYWRAKVGLPK
jgi:hypothetical protein